MRQRTESVTESSKLLEPANRFGLRETHGPRYGTTIHGGVKLKADPKTGKVSLDESDPYTRAHLAKQNSASAPTKGKKILAPVAPVASKSEEAKPLGNVGKR